MVKTNQTTQIVKKAYTPTTYTSNQIRELARCYNDPLYFMENFVHIQHPIKGRQLLTLYPFQTEMVKTIHENRFSILLTARQMGKCLYKSTKIKTKSPKGSIIELDIGDFYEWQKFRQWAKTVPELRDII
ncbi:MAG: hypothetical protein HC836_32815 [Richelia sp. RM2_1_2]|nr:hypothetical protein [Richelia sp. RM2_1_2]